VLLHFPARLQLQLQLLLRLRLRLLLLIWLQKFPLFPTLAQMARAMAPRHRCQCQSFVFWLPLNLLLGHQEIFQFSPWRKQQQHQHHFVRKKWQYDGSGYHPLQQLSQHLYGQQQWHIVSHIHFGQVELPGPEGHLRLCPEKARLQKVLAIGPMAHWPNVVVIDIVIVIVIVIVVVSEAKSSFSTRNACACVFC
jgi:hypothetical protein